MGILHSNDPKSEQGVQEKPECLLCDIRSAFSTSPVCSNKALVNCYAFEFMERALGDINTATYNLDFQRSCIERALIAEQFDPQRSNSVPHFTPPTFTRYPEVHKEGKFTHMLLAKQ
ncbi:uncharacterized protein ACMZJ9_015572 [Mantella aurantiaca]